MVCFHFLKSKITSYDFLTKKQTTFDTDDDNDDDGDEINCKWILILKLSNTE